MTGVSVYPRRIDFGKTPTGSRSPGQWIHLANYFGRPVAIDDWGVDGHFVSSGPGVTSLAKSGLIVEIKANAPASGSSRWLTGGDGYIFEGNTISGIGVFKVAADGTATEVSRYGALVPTASVGQMHYDGRFLYVCHANGLHVFNLDQFGNLRLKSIFDPHSAGVVGVHGSGKYIATVDSTRVSTHTMDHLGQLTLVDTKTVSGSSDFVWSRDGWVFVSDVSTPSLKAYRIDAAGRMTLTDTYAGSAGYSGLHGDQDYVYTFDGTDGVSSFSVDTAGILTREDVAAFPAVGDGPAYFDGAYVHASNGYEIHSYSVDRDTGALDLVLSEIEVVDKFRDMWFFDGQLIVSKSDEGLIVFDFDGSRVMIPVAYTPGGYEHHEGEISVQGSVVKLEGNSPATFSPYTRSTPESITLKGDMRWDRITFEFYGSFDRIEDVKDANPQIPSSIRNRSFVPSGSIIHKPVPPATGESTIGAVEWRRP